jgi:catechol 2,3-dioxygenase-like lactoylglutathione lyase family enzyme
VKLARAILFAKDMARMTTFYRDTLGLPAIDVSTPSDWVTLDAGGVELALHAIPLEIASKIVIVDPPERRGETPLKLVFFVPDIASTFERLVRHGVSMSEPRTFGTRTFCDGLDPEGNVFQIANH